MRRPIRQAFWPFSRRPRPRTRPSPASSVATRKPGMTDQAAFMRGRKAIDDVGFLNVDARRPRPSLRGGPSTGLCDRLFQRRLDDVSRSVRSFPAVWPPSPRWRVPAGAMAQAETARFALLHHRRLGPLESAGRRGAEVRLRRRAESAAGRNRRSATPSRNGRRRWPARRSRARKSDQGGVKTRDVSARAATERKSSS